MNERAHNFNDKGTCTVCGCSRDAIERFGWKCKPQAQPPPIPGAGRMSQTTADADSPSNSYRTAAVTTPETDFKALLDLATPDLYERNAFRLLEVHVEATDRDLSKRKQVMEVAARNKLPVPPGPYRIFPRTPAPDDHEIRECSHAIQDAERRLAHEFFWFWPLTVGQGGNDASLRQLHQGDSDGSANIWRNHEQSQDDGPAAKHNLAILYHYAALHIETNFLNDKSPPPLPGAEDGETAKQELAKAADAESFWAEANKYWNVIAVEQSCWSRVVARIRAMDDKSLTTGAARRMEMRLPVALALIAARLAVRFQQTGKPHHADRQVARLRASGLPAEAVAEALRIAIEPTRSTIKALCDAAKKDADANPAKADIVVDRLLDQTAEALTLLDLFLPEDNPARIAEHDQIALAALSCQISFGNKTENWERCLELFDRVTSLAASTAAKERVSHNRKVVQSNFDSSWCFFCKQEASKDDAGMEVKMHGNVQRIPTYGGVRITWQHAAVKVPRCPACKTLHGKIGNANAGMGCGGVLAVVLGIIACILMSNSEWGWFLIVVLGAGLASWWCACGIKNKPALGSVLPEASHKEHPRIKELLAEGWTWGERPNTQQ